MSADIGLIVAIVGSAMAIVGVMIAMFLWIRGEANDDRRNFLETQQQDRKDLISLHRSTERAFEEHRKETNEISRSIEKIVFAIQEDSARLFQYPMLHVPSVNRVG